MTSDELEIGKLYKQIDNRILAFDNDTEAFGIRDLISKEPFLVLECLQKGNLYKVLIEGKVKFLNYIETCQFKEMVD